MAVARYDDDGSKASDWDSWKSTAENLIKILPRPASQAAKDWWSGTPTVSNAPSSEKEWSNWKSTGKSGKSMCRSAKSSKVSSKWDSWSGLAFYSIKFSFCIQKPAWWGSWGSEKSGKSAKIFGDKSGKSSSGKSSKWYTSWPTVDCVKCTVYVIQADLVVGLGSVLLGQQVQQKIQEL